MRVEITVKSVVISSFNPVYHWAMVEKQTISEIILNNDCSQNWIGHRKVDTRLDIGYRILDTQNTRF